MTDPKPKPIIGEGIEDPTEMEEDTVHTEGELG